MVFIHLLVCWPILIQVLFSRHLVDKLSDIANDKSKSNFNYGRFNWDSLHARLSSHYKAWSYKKKERKKIKAYRKFLYKELTVNTCQLILDLKPLRS